MNKPIRYISLFSGIEAATVAWEPLGFKAVAYSDIEPFACALLKHHYPDVPNLGDVTKINGKDYKGIDILVGGSPCQSFSTAGLRGGLSDTRGNLCLKYVELANDIDPTVIVWENVPGVLSMPDNAFGHLLGGLAGEPVEMVPPGGKWLNAGCVFGPRRTVAWRILDAKHFGVAQRRKRIFVVACPSDRADPLEILFETAPVRRDTEPSVPKGKHLACTPEGLAGTVCRKWATGSGGPSGNEYHNLVIDRHASHWNGDVHPTLSTEIYGTTKQELFGQGGACLVPARIRPGSDGEHIHVYPVDLRMLLRDIEKQDEIPVGAEGNPAYTLTRAHTHAVAVCGEDEEIEAAVRKLTPLECERLQGFPDNYTDFPYRGKDHAPDTHRYAALGNSMAVPCMRWIGERIKAQLCSTAS